MDGSHYPSNGISNNSGQTYPSPTSLSPNHLQNGSPLPQTLPPLQPATVMQPLYGSHPHTPRTPGTPNTPNSTSNLPSYQSSSQPGGRPGLYSMAQNPYPPHQGYGTTSAMMPNATTAAAHPQPIAPAPANNRGPPVLRPMPPGGLSMQPGVSSPYGAGSMMQANPGLQDSEPPTHVVGSQGRRGILPSAPGRPAAPAAGTGASKSTVIPVKDADGKFPCPHCTKTYLHAKHLKRHLLRHTGDRPYMCVLCRDTFSRSDILKRHFQKCSIRRGNPTGASHLSHPNAHVKKNQQQKAAGMGNEGDFNGLNNMSNDGMVHPFGMVPVGDGMNNMPGDQNHLSRSSSMGRVENGNNADRRGMPGPMMGASQPYGSDPNSMGNQQMPNYNMPPGQNGMPMYGQNNTSQQSGLDWSQMFQGAHNTYANNPIHPNRGQTQIATKTEPDSKPGLTDDGAGVDLYHPSWGLLSNMQQPYDKLSDQILNFFFPAHEAIDPQMAGMNLYFSADNIKDFLTLYTHFHVHTPLVHVSTFRITEAYTGLLAAMCCIGACYSDCVESANVREMMDFIWTALERDCDIWSGNALAHDLPRRDVEELQAILLMSILLTWNGMPEQRERARQIFPFIESRARRLNLLEVPQHAPSPSPLHQPDLDARQFDNNLFNWDTWIWQETRIRIMYGVYLLDVALGLYFNHAPAIHPFEVHLPLPCDDAAWDADTRENCMAALGLLGPAMARETNPYGTQRPKQPEMDWALKALLHDSYQIQPGSTNLYGKFVLIHSITALIRRAQLDGNASQLFSCATPPPHDWMIAAAESTNGRSTPVEGIGQSMDSKTVKALSTALGKFKTSWDIDMGTQFPPMTTGLENPRRHGFSRDGIHYYWLAKYMLKFTRPTDLQMPPDTRMMHVMRLLKSVRTWVKSDGASRGEELGSIGEIDEQYGTANLTLEMRQLFKPLPRVVEDAGTASVKTEFEDPAVG